MHVVGLGPKPVGGIAELPEVAELGLDFSGSSGHSNEVLAGVAAAAAAFGPAMGVVAEYAWKRLGGVG